MSTTNEGEQPQPARTKEEIEADLEATREHLADTVDALGHKLDVKTRSREKAAAIKHEHGNELAIGAGIVLAVAALLLLRRRRQR